MAKNPVKITDTTLRDGHQSLVATRMRTEDMLEVAGEFHRGVVPARGHHQRPPSTRS